MPVSPVRHYVASPVVDFVQYDGTNTTDILDWLTTNLPFISINNDFFDDGNGNLVVRNSKVGGGQSRFMDSWVAPEGILSEVLVPVGTYVGIITVSYVIGGVRYYSPDDYVLQSSLDKYEEV